jgi:hypothetical protein
LGLGGKGPTLRGRRLDLGDWDNRRRRLDGQMLNLSPGDCPLTFLRSSDEEQVGFGKTLSFELVDPVGR